MTDSSTSFPKPVQSPNANVAPPSMVQNSGNNALNSPSNLSHNSPSIDIPPISSPPISQISEQPQQQQINLDINMNAALQQQQQQSLMGRYNMGGVSGISNSFQRQQQQASASYYGRLNQQIRQQFQQLQEFQQQLQLQQQVQQHVQLLLIQQQQQLEQFQRQQQQQQLGSKNLGWSTLMGQSGSLPLSSGQVADGAAQLNLQSQLLNLDERLSRKSSLPYLNSQLSGLSLNAQSDDEQSAMLQNSLSQQQLMEQNAAMSDPGPGSPPMHLQRYQRHQLLQPQLIQSSQLQQNNISLNTHQLSQLV